MVVLVFACFCLSQGGTTAGSWQHSRWLWAALPPGYGPALPARVAPTAIFQLQGINSCFFPKWKAAPSLPLSSIVDFEKLALSLDPSMILVPI
jgi:hypothetical protein